MSIELPPFYFRRAWLRGFWITLSIGTGLAIATLFIVLTIPNAVWFGAWVAIPMAALGLLKPDIVRLPYRAFNAIVRRFSPLAARYFSFLCYYFVLVPIAYMARLGPSPEQRPGWSPPTHRPIESNGEHGGAGELARFCSTVIRSDPWMLALVPFILLQRLVSDPRRDTDPVVTDTYTLY